MALELVWVKQSKHQVMGCDWWVLGYLSKPGTDDWRSDWDPADYPHGAYECIGSDLPMPAYPDDVVVPVRLLDPDEQEAIHQMCHQCLGPGEECERCGLLF